MNQSFCPPSENDLIQTASVQSNPFQTDSGRRLSRSESSFQHHRQRLAAENEHLQLTEARATANWWAYAANQWPYPLAGVGGEFAFRPMLSYRIAYVRFIARLREAQAAHPGVAWGYLEG